MQFLEALLESTPISKSTLRSALRSSFGGFAFWEADRNSLQTILMTRFLLIARTPCLQEFDRVGSLYFPTPKVPALLRKTICFKLRLARTRISFMEGNFWQIHMERSYGPMRPCKALDLPLGIGAVSLLQFTAKLFPFLGFVWLFSQ